ncbi:MAG: hypothetical protein QGG88_04630 [Gammaproteobacteria bacterium]|nr:hypothetical protein [Gammaproteobacteria bacterium]
MPVPKQGVSEVFLCCGEALIDMVPMQGAAGENGFHTLPSGAIFNAGTLASLMDQHLAIPATLAQ